MKNSILLKNHYLMGSINDNNYEYLAAKLLNTFGVIVDKPNKLNHIHVKLISEFFGLNIPSSFYNNPQDLKYFTCGELLLEQLVSYFKIEFITGVNSENKEDFERIEIFKKVLPNYEEGKEVVFRKYTILSKEEADDVLFEYTENLSNYNRPWSLSEKDEFIWLYENGYYKGTKLNSKDNTIEMFNKYEVADFAKSLDQKDIVKLSIQMKGEQQNLIFTEDEISKLTIAIKNCYPTKLTKKQAKYFNTLNKHLKTNLKIVTNKLSPYKIATMKVKENDIVGAAKIFANNGSMLERNLVWLLSRADYNQAREIMDLVKVNNPLVSIQFVNGLLETNNDNRTFKFHKNNKIKKHVETDEERKYRKSIISENTKKLVREIMNEKIDDYYRNQPSLGKVYIEDIFKKIALPLNTDASSSGLDVVPVGSRLPIKGDYIRTFTYWKGVTDIDTSVSFIKNGKICGEPLYWGNYNKKAYGLSALTSGDDRSRDGAEYIDFKISELKHLGFTHALYSLNGFGGTLNEGEIFTGYQNKDNLDTQTWSSKNIETKIQVKGDSRTFLAFAIDFSTNEIIMINQMLTSDNRVISSKDFEITKQHLNSKYLEAFNIYKIVSLRSELVENPEEADIIFAENSIGYKLNDKQKLITTNNIAKFINIL